MSSISRSSSSATRQPAPLLARTLLGGEQHGLVDRQHRVGAGVLRHVADRPGSVGAVDMHHAVAFQEAGDALEQRRFCRRRWGPITAVSAPPSIGPVVMSAKMVARP